MFTSDETPDLDSKFSAALEDLRADFSLQLQEAKNEIQELKSHLQPHAADTYLARQRYEGPASSPDDLSALHFAITQFDIARTQAEILEVALAESGRFASRAAVFVGQEGALQGWGSYGFDSGVREFSQVTLGHDSFPLFADLQNGDGSILMSGANSALLCKAFGTEAAEQAILIPIVLSDNVVGAVYADQLAGFDSFNVLALQLLTHAAAQAIESLPGRSRQSTATLYLASTSTVAEQLREDPEVELASDPSLESEAAEAWVADPDPVVDSAEEPVEIEASPDAEEEVPLQVDIADSDEQLLEEVSDSLYVDSPDDIEDADIEAHAVDDYHAAENEEQDSGVLEESDPSDPVEKATFETEVAAFDEVDQLDATDDVGSEEKLESSSEEESSEQDHFISASDEDKDADVTPPFESNNSSALADSDPEVGDAYLVSPDELDAADADKSVDEEVAAEFAEETVYSEPSGPVLVDPLEESLVIEEAGEVSESDQLVEFNEPLEPAEPEEFGSEPAQFLGNLETDEPSGLYAEDDSTSEEPGSQEFGYSHATSEVDPTDSSPLQEDHLQPTGEPSAIFSQTAGIPHIPAPGTTSTPITRPSGAEIAPPSDLDGPGWAFTETAPAGTNPEDAKREEAKRLARLLITEIKLYNEEDVEEGRQSLDLTKRLGEEIERSRQIYDNRIDESIRSEADYFQEELVNILAGGNAEALS